MKAPGAAGSCRRRCQLRRFLFLAALLHCLSHGDSALHAQQPPGLRILERQVRLTLDERGDYRVIDAMLVRLDMAQSDPFVLSAPLPLVAVQAEALDARGLGGDVSPRQLAQVGDQLAVVGAIPRQTFEVGMTYRLRHGVEALVLSSSAAVDELSVFVDRGRIRVRPEGGLVRREDIGPASQPSLSYVASDLPEGSTLRLSIVSLRTGWRARFAVLIATLLAAGFAGVWAWRRAG